MKIFVKRENWSDGIWMQLPATKEEAEQVRRSLERQHPSMMLPFVGAVDSKFPELEERLVGELVFQEKNLDRLNQLAERLGSLNGAEEMLFRAAFRMEAPYTTEQILETLGHLDRYRLHPEIGNLEELGRYLSQEETSQLPERLEAYVDYAGIGRLRQEDRGYLTEGGYVEKRKDLVEQTEAGEEQNREKEPETEKRQETEKMQGIFAVTLIRESFTDRYVRFTLPLPEQELTEKKRQAGFGGETPERMEIFAGVDGLLEHLPPGSTLEELNQTAKVIKELETCSGIDWKLAFAALEAELPGTMEECCHVIWEYKTYEFLPFPFLEPESYAHYHLEQAGLSVPEGLSSCFDYRRYGQEKIAEDGVTETFYGVVINREHPICLDHGERQELKLYSPLTLTTFAGYPLFPALLHGEKMPAFQTVIRKEIAKSIWTVRTVPFMLIKKRSEMKMDREEIYEMVIREMTETAVRERNEQSPEEQELQDRVARLSKEMQEKIKDLPEDVKKSITDYVEATLLAADHDCLYLYVQGAKDCVALLKKLGVL